MSRIVAIGGIDVILPFKAIGAEIFAVNNVEEAKDILKKIITEDVGIILIMDEFIPQVNEILSKIKGTHIPCIAPIPKGENWTKELYNLIKKAIGIDVVR